MSNITNITSQFINRYDSFDLGRYLSHNSDDAVATQIINSRLATEEDRAEVVTSVREFREALVAWARSSHKEWAKVDHRKEKALFFTGG